MNDLLKSGRLGTELRAPGLAGARSLGSPTTAFPTWVVEQKIAVDGLGSGWKEKRHRHHLDQPFEGQAVEPRQRWSLA